MFEIFEGVIFKNKFGDCDGIFVRVEVCCERSKSEKCAKLTGMAPTFVSVSAFRGYGKEVVSLN